MFGIVTVEQRHELYGVISPPNSRSLFMCFFFSHFGIVGLNDSTFEFHVSRFYIPSFESRNSSVIPTNEES